MDHIIDCDEPWFSMLENGTKKVEGRKGLPKYRSIKAGDRVISCCTEESKRFSSTVKRVDCFNNLDDYLNGVTLSEALPGIKTMEEVRKICSMEHSRRN